MLWSRCSPGKGNPQIRSRWLVKMQQQDKNEERRSKICVGKNHQKKGSYLTHSLSVVAVPWSLEAMRIIGKKNAGASFIFISLIILDPSQPLPYFFIFLLIIFFFAVPTFVLLFSITLAQHNSIETNICKDDDNPDRTPTLRWNHGSNC